jgi:hypothetical protein
MGWGGRQPQAVGRPQRRVCEQARAPRCAIGVRTVRGFMPGWPPVLAAHSRRA